jgi:hypothetical protein
VPALFAIFPISIRPAFRRWSRDDQVEAAAVGVFAGLYEALYVEWFKPSSHCSSERIVLRTHGLQLRSATRLGRTRRTAKYSLSA